MKTLYNIFILIIILGSLVLSIFAIYREDYVVSILMIGIAFVSAFMLSDLGNKLYQRLFNYNGELVQYYINHDYQVISIDPNRCDDEKEFTKGYRTMYPVRNDEINYYLGLGYEII